MTSGRSAGGSAADRAHAHIRAAIVSGELAAGRMLSENELAAQLAMSRTPVRSALVRLQDEGWVSIYAQRGALVRGLSPQEVRDSAEVRHALETEGVLRSTERGRRGLADRVRADLEEQEEALAQADVHAFAPLSLRFHRAFVELAENQAMLAMYDRLQDRQQLSIRQSAGRITGEPQRVVAEHRGLLEAAQRGDWIAFARLLDAHQQRSHDLEGGLPDDLP